MTIEISDSAKALISKPAENRQSGAGVSVQIQEPVVQESVEARIADSKEDAKEVQQAAQQNLEEAVSRLKDHVQNLQRDLQFSVSESTGRTIVTVVDSETGETIRQIPPEEVISLAEHMDSMQGALLSAKV